MAGEWIKMRVALHDDSDVMRMADKLDIDEFSVCGRLLAVWSWADANTTNGFVPGGTVRRVDAKAGISGFADAMVSVGWLKVREDGVEFPNWEVHNSKSAKKRAQDSKRKQDERNKEKGSGQMSGSKADKCPPEKRTNVTLENGHLFSSLLFSSSPSGSSDLEGPLPEKWDQTPDLEQQQADQRKEFLTNIAGAGFGWNDCEGALDRAYTDIPKKHRSSFHAIRGDPDLWPLLQDAVKKLRPGLNGLTFSLGTVLSEEGIRKVLGVRDDSAKRGRSNGPVIGTGDRYDPGRAGSAADFER